jgi:hypothetical protein
MATTERTRKPTDANARTPEPSPRGLAARRLEAATESGLEGPSARFLDLQKHVLNFVSDHYFRTEFEGWDRVPDETCLVVGVHSGGALTMDAWMLVHAWWRRFGVQRSCTPPPTTC